MLALVGVLAAAPAAWAHDNDYEIRVLSSPAEMVTGGDALVEVSVPRHQSLHVRIKFMNGDDVTSAFDVDSSKRTLTGLVGGLELGENRLTVYAFRHHKWRKQAG